MISICVQSSPMFGQFAIEAISRLRLVVQPQHYVRQTDKKAHDPVRSIFSTERNHFLVSFACLLDSLLQFSQRKCTKTVSIGDGCADCGTRNGWGRHSSVQPVTSSPTAFLREDNRTKHPPTFKFFKSITPASVNTQLFLIVLLGLAFFRLTRSLLNLLT